MKDKASGVGGNPFTSQVEAATAVWLTTPDLSQVTGLAAQSNGEEDAERVVQAFRRRLSNSDPKVQYLTILALQALVRSGGPRLHLAVAEARPLQKNLVDIALLTNPTKPFHPESRRAAAQFILNCAAWFKPRTGNSSSNKLTPLADMATWVRQVNGSAFNGMVDEPLQGDQSSSLSFYPSQQNGVAKKQTPPVSPPQFNQQPSNGGVSVHQHNGVTYITTPPPMMMGPPPPQQMMMVPTWQPTNGGYPQYPSYPPPMMMPGGGYFPQQPMKMPPPPQHQFPPYQQQYQYQYQHQHQQQHLAQYPQVQQGRLVQPHYQQQQPAGPPVVFQARPLTSSTEVYQQPIVPQHPPHQTSQPQPKPEQPRISAAQPQPSFSAVSSNGVAASTTTSAIGCGAEDARPSAYHDDDAVDVPLSHTVPLYTHSSTMDELEEPLLLL